MAPKMLFMKDNPTQGKSEIESLPALISFLAHRKKKELKLRKELQIKGVTFHNSWT